MIMGTGSAWFMMHTTGSAPRPTLALYEIEDLLTLLEVREAFLCNSLKELESLPKLGDSVMRKLKTQLEDLLHQARVEMLEVSRQLEDARYRGVIEER